MKTACIASMPCREKGLKRVVAALLPQVDEIRICLNSYRKVPSWLARCPNVKAILTGGISEVQDVGPEGKFFWAEELTGYVLTCDDDIGFPPDYAERMVAAVDKYDGKAIVCVHGEVVGGAGYHYKHGLAEDMPVNKPGTGTCAWNADILHLPKHPAGTIFNVDPRIGLWARENGIPCVAIAREEGWLRVMRGFTNPSVYGNMFLRNSAKAWIRRNGPWTLPPLNHK